MDGLDSADRIYARRLDGRLDVDRDEADPVRLVVYTLGWATDEPAADRDREPTTQVYARATLNGVEIPGLLSVTTVSSGDFQRTTIEVMAATVDMVTVAPDVFEAETLPPVDPARVR